jgi:LCP family protein required for cell wall assembly
VSKKSPHPNKEPRPERGRPGPPADEEEPATGQGQRYSPLIVFGISAFAVVALYLLLVVVTQIDHIFFPGNEVKPGILAKVLPGIDSGENPEAADIEERINILVLGLDRRLDQPKEAPYRADTIFILTVDPFSKTAGGLSIPRDLLVDIPDDRGLYFQDRINTAYVYGETQIDYPGGGPGLAIATVEHNFHIPIDYYVVLDFVAFMDLINELGGVDIDVPEYVFDPEYWECQDSSGCPPRYVEFSAGLQHMDGQTALAYARLRHTDNDLKRIERQQLVMRAAAEKATGLNLFDIVKARSLYAKYKDATTTDINDFRIPGLAKLAQQVDTERVRLISLKDAVAGETLPSGASVLIADWDKVEQIKAQIFLDGRLQAEAARIQVQNGSSDPAMATDFADFLARQGLPPALIQVIEAGDGQFNHLTKIYDLNGKDHTAEKLAEWLLLGEDRIIDSSDPEAAPYLASDADILVVLGTDTSLSGR